MIILAKVNSALKYLRKESFEIKNDFGNKFSVVGMDEVEKVFKELLIYDTIYLKLEDLKKIVEEMNEFSEEMKKK